LSRLPRITPREVVAGLRRAVFVQLRQRGSHILLYHAALNRRVTMSMHSGTLAPKTLTPILRQSGLTAQELRELI